MTSPTSPHLRTLLQTVRPSARRAWKVILGGLVSMIGVSIMKLLIPWPMKLIVDQVLIPSAGRPRLDWLPASPMSALTLLCIGLVVIYIAKGWLFSRQEIAMARAGRAMILALRSSLFRKIMELPQAFHYRRKSGDLLTRLMTDVNQIKELIFGVGFDAIGDLVTVVGMLAILTWHDPMLALVAMAAGPLVLIPSRIFSRRIRGAAREQRKRQGELAGSVNEILRSLRVVQAFDRAESHQQAFDLKDAGQLDADVRMTRLQTNLFRIVEMGVAVGSALILWLGARRVLAGQLSPGDLIVFTQYVRTMYRPFQDMAKLAGRWNKALASAERITDILETPDTLPDPLVPVPLQRATGAVTFRDVTFGYEGRPAVLSNLDFHLAAGESMALIGPSGIGKSTLSSLVLRLHDPRTGSVQLDGIDVRRYRKADLRRQVAVVFQEPCLFGVSVRDNIAYGREGATEAEVEAAARAARAHDFILEMPEGYDSVLGEHGTTLSAGQRQRLAIARALLRDAPILILDEPMTGLDEGNRREVAEALRTLRQGRTSILITHNMEDIEGIDRILRLDASGGLREAGRLPGADSPPEPKPYAFNRS